MAKKIIKTKYTEVSVENNFPDIFKNIDKRVLENGLNFVITREILPLIDKGLSPVAGQRTLAKYKNPKKYPAKLKQSNKPNLTLTGEMLSNYYAKVPADKILTATMGIHSDVDARNRMLTNVHNNGIRSDIPMRPFIPKEKNGEGYTAKIAAAIRRVFGYVIAKSLADDKNKKR